MNIGFDAKRAYHNDTGLGFYSRTLLSLLSEYYPEHHYYLFNPKPANRFQLRGNNFHEILPEGFLNKFFSSAWRSSWVTRDLKKLKIDLYHGLSHEIPLGINNTGIKSIVTIHDLIHERHPEQYNAIDVKIYSKKFRYACIHADLVIAISEQTKKDIIELYKIPEKKVTVCYQSCSPVFAEKINDEGLRMVKEKYGLPDQYFLHVGSIIERKNLLNICKAIHLLHDDINIPLVVIGKGGKYKEQVKEYIRQNKIEDKIIFLSEGASENILRNDQAAMDFPAIYQSAVAMLYPSFYEGFGLPVLEALWSRLPVITSNVSCLPEVGGPGAYYVDPNSAEEIAAGMRKIVSDKSFVESMREKNRKHILNFAPEKYVAHMMEIYKSVW
jgi:glycosyltransferase involved in cell wall biosynthesis